MSLKAVLNSDISKFKKDMKSADGIAGALNSSFAKIGTAAAAYFSIEGLKSFTNALSNIGEAAERVGLQDKLEEFQKLNYAARQSGAGMENVEAGMRKMQDAIGGALNGDTAAQKSINGIGLAVADLAAMSPDEQFSAIAAAIRGIDNPAKRTAALIDIFGKSGTMLLPMINELENLKQEASDVGAVIDGKLIESARKAADQFQSFNDIMLATAANSGIVDHLNNVAAGLLAVVSNGKKLEALGGKKSDWMEDAATFAWNYATFGNADSVFKSVGVDTNMRMNVTDAERKKLEDAKKKKEASGGKTAAQIKDDEKAAQAARVAEEMAKKNNQIIAEKIASMQEDINLQEMKNKGLEIEGERLKTIAELQKRIGRELNEQQLAEINAVYARKEKLKYSKADEDAAKTVKDEAFKLRDELLKQSGTDTIFESMKRSIEEKTGSELSLDNLDRLKELASLSQELNYSNDLSKFQMPELQTTTNDLARMGGFNASVVGVSGEDINRRIEQHTNAQVELLKKVNELLEKMPDKIGKL